MSFVKPNEQHRTCSNVAMTRIGNRQHGALGEVERQNALFEEREKAINSRHLGDTSGLVVALQKACTDTTSIL